MEYIERNFGKRKKLWFPINYELNTGFLIRKALSCLSLNFLNIMLEIRLRFSKYFS